MEALLKLIEDELPEGERRAFGIERGGGCGNKCATRRRRRMMARGRCRRGLRSGRVLVSDRSEQSCY